MEVQQAPQWRVEVRDDGCGFAADAADADETHVGLRIMRERAERIGASGGGGLGARARAPAVVLTLPRARRRLAA